MVGFKAVEYLSLYALPGAELAQRLQSSGLQQVLFNAPRQLGRGRARAGLPAGDVRPSSARGIAKAVEYAQACSAPAST